MKVKLIAPRSSMRPMDSLWKARMAPPLSLLVIAALTPPEHEVTIEDENIQRLSLDDHPDLVGITAKVDTFQCPSAVMSRESGVGRQQTGVGRQQTGVGRQQTGVGRQQT